MIVPPSTNGADRNGQQDYLRTAIGEGRAADDGRIPFRAEKLKNKAI